MRCAVFGCKADCQSKDFKHDIKFFSFPRDKKMQDVWKRLCRRSDDFNIKYARICSKHFDESDYERNLKHELLGYSPKNFRPLKKEGIPSKLLLKDNHHDSGREQRHEKRQRKNVEGADFSSANGSSDDGTICDIDPLSTSTRNIGVNTDTELEDQDKLIASLQEKIKFLEQRQDLIGKLFSSEQQKKLEGAKTRLRWSVEDISKSIVIYAAGPRAYRLLLKKGYPLPAVSSLRSWLKKIRIVPGILKNVFNIMKFFDMSFLNKVCVISFGEMKIREAYLYDKVNDETMKPYSYAQVVMLRGLFRSWKQPIFYDFDFKLTKEKLFELIQCAESSGFQVVAMVSDLEGGNRSLYNELNISHNNTWFNNPANNEKVYVIADVPHLIKLIRDHFIDHGFIINGKEINKSIIEDILDVTRTSDLKISHKISEESLNIKGAARQMIKLATKLFSNTISMAITRCGTMGTLNQPNWAECAEFFKLVNDWFDIMNVGGGTSDGRERTKAYGVALEHQESIINAMTSTMENLRVKGRTSLLPFQKDIIMTNTSLRLLFDDLRTRFSTKYLLTYRLNQDALESCFGTLQAKGGLHDHPDALEFKYRLRSYILGRNEGRLSSFENIEDVTPDASLDEVNLCGKYFCSVDQNNEPEEPHDIVHTELSCIGYNELEDLAGYIYHKLKQPDDSIASTETSDYTWISHLSERGITKPSPEFMAQIEELEKVFKSLNSDNLFISKNYLKKLFDMSSSVLCSDKIRMLFFRSRLYFRIRQLNRDLHNATVSRKRKMSKIIK